MTTMTKKRPPGRPAGKGRFVMPTVRFEPKMNSRPQEGGRKQRPNLER